MSEPMPDGSSPFEDHECGRLPCPRWLGDEEAVVAVESRTAEESELEPPRHLHDLWIVLGLGEE